jgi:methionine sulfoxide reductase heme-binding subunit
MPLLSSRTALRLKPVVILLMLLPALWLAWHWLDFIATGYSATLTVNPVEHSIRNLGDWGLRFLIVGLALSPLARFTKTPGIIAWRRNVGVITFIYVFLHVTMYVALDLELSLTALWADVVKRTYITFGMAALLLLTPLAITSTNGWIKRIGAKRWQTLHRSVYAAVLLGGVHYLYMVKGNQPAPKIYLAIIGVLLVLRLVPQRRAAKIQGLR